MSALFRRASSVPAAVVGRAGLARGERVLAHAESVDGTWLLGTRDAFVAVGQAGTTRVPWEDVETADWDRDTERLRVAEVGTFGRPRPVHRFAVHEAGLLLQLVRERVTASVVLQRRVDVAGRRGLTVIARRAPRGTGDITFAYEFDPGVDPGDPQVQDAAERGLRAARDEIGL